jgi:SAM-dependent methyltransferase
MLSAMSEPSVPATFGTVADSYAAARPGYPEALFDWLGRIAPARDLAWDCACGSGQASAGLARVFRHVHATDASAEQIAAAAPDDRIDYAVAAAEDSRLPDGAVDLVTVAQGLHWLPWEAFYAEVRRVARPGGVIAAWSYYWLTTGDEQVDAILESLSDHTLGAYWPPGREHVDNGYADLPFPFPRLVVPPFELRARWTLDRLLAYVRSWSAVSRYRDRHGTDPVAAVEPALAAAWGDRHDMRDVSWPLTVLAGRVS